MTFGVVENFTGKGEPDPLTCTTISGEPSGILRFAIVRGVDWPPLTYSHVWSRANSMLIDHSSQFSWPSSFSVVRVAFQGQTWTVAWV